MRQAVSALWGGPRRRPSFALHPQQRSFTTVQNERTPGTPMKILQTKTAPNPRRVRIFLAEKGIAVPYEELDIVKDLKTAQFTCLNPFQRVPVLILDDGTPIAET